MSENLIGKKVVTQQTLADAIGLHISTVSLALRNSKRLAKATRERVQRAAEQLGYNPDPFVSVLMSRIRRRGASPRGILAYVSTGPRPDQGGCEGTDPLELQAARRRAGQFGYGIDAFHLSADSPESPGKLQRLFYYRNISGIILFHVPGITCPDGILPLDFRDHATVLLGAPLNPPIIHHVADDHFMRPITAARKLIDLGYRRLGLLVEESLDRQFGYRCSAGFWSLQQSAPDCAVLPMLRFDDNPGNELPRWLRRHRPDVLLCYGRMPPLAVEGCGFRVPEEIGWCHLDWRAEMHPAAGVSANGELAGGKAVEILVAQIHGGESGPPACAMSHLIPARWIEGATVRRIGDPMSQPAGIAS